jgi:hypothetical protein
MAEQCAARVVNGDLNAALGVFAEGGICRRQDSPEHEVNRFAVGDLDTTERICCADCGGVQAGGGALGHALGSASARRRACRGASREDEQQRERDGGPSHVLLHLVLLQVFRRRTKAALAGWAAS